MVDEVADLVKEARALIAGRLPSRDPAAEDEMIVRLADALEAQQATIELRTAQVQSAIEIAQPLLEARAPEFPNPIRCDNPVANGERKEADPVTGMAPVGSASTNLARAPESGGALGRQFALELVRERLTKWADGNSPYVGAFALQADVKALVAALAQPAGRSGGEWRDIADAPKDGTPILLGAPARAYQGKPVAPRSTEGYWYIPEHGKYLGDCGAECRCPEYGDPEPPGWISMDGGFTEENPPTRWMPLPAPPTGEPG